MAIIHAEACSSEVEGLASCSTGQNDKAAFQTVRSQRDHAQKGRCFQDLHLPESLICDCADAFLIQLYSLRAQEYLTCGKVATCAGNRGMLAKRVPEAFPTLARMPWETYSNYAGHLPVQNIASGAHIAVRHPNTETRAIPAVQCRPCNLSPRPSTLNPKP